MVRKSANGVREYAIDFISKNAKPKARVLVVGTGDFELERHFLHSRPDIKFFSVDCEELDDVPDNTTFAVHNIDKSYVVEFGVVTSFDLVIATEVIEHLNKPVNLLRLIEIVLFNSKGKALITTPNILSSEHRAKSLLFGDILSFDHHALCHFGHKMPISLHYLRYLIYTQCHNLSIFKTSFIGRINYYKPMKSLKSYVYDAYVYTVRNFAKMFGSERGRDVKMLDNKCLAVCLEVVDDK